MKDNKEKSFKTKKLGALDVFIILAVIACIAAVAVRYFSISSSDVKDSVKLDEYVISFEVTNIRNSSAQNYFDAGTKFYLDEGDDLFGVLREGVTISDAKTYYEMPDGSVILAQDNASGDLYKVDVEASVTALGKQDANGSFLLGGNKYLATNKELLIYSKYLSITVKVTGIAKAQ